MIWKTKWDIQILALLKHLLDIKKNLNDPQDAVFGEPPTLSIYEELWFSFKVTHKNKRKQIETYTYVYRLALAYDDYLFLSSNLWTLLYRCLPPLFSLVNFNIHYTRNSVCNLHLSRNGQRRGLTLLNSTIQSFLRKALYS